MLGAFQALRPSAWRARWNAEPSARAARSLAVTTSPPWRSHASISVPAVAPIPALYAAGPGECHSSSGQMHTCVARVEAFASQARLLIDLRLRIYSQNLGNENAFP